MGKIFCPTYYQHTFQQCQKDYTGGNGVHCGGFGVYLSELQDFYLGKFSQIALTMPERRWILDVAHATNMHVS